MKLSDMMYVNSKAYATSCVGSEVTLPPELDSCTLRFRRPLLTRFLELQKLGHYSKFGRARIFLILLLAERVSKLLWDNFHFWMN